MRALRCIVLSIAVGLYGATTAGGGVRSLEFATEGSCVHTHIRLTLSVRATSGATEGTGTLISIPLEILGEPPKETTALTGETDNPAGLDTVELVMLGADHRLVVRYLKPVRYRVQMESETRHIRIDTVPVGGTGCNMTTAEPDRNQPEAPADDVSEARYAMAERRFGDARAALARAARSSHAATRRSADEVSGVLLESERRFAEAAAQYRRFLSLYTKGEDVERVKQRLAELAPVLTPAATQRAGVEPAGLEDNRQDLGQGIDPDTSLAGLRGERTLPEDPAAWSRPRLTGGIGQTVYHRSDHDGDEEGRSISDVALQASSETKDWRAVTRLDLVHRSDRSIGDFIGDGRSSVSTAYAELAQKRPDKRVDKRVDKRPGTAIRVGRQSRSDGGIFGRFDGVWLGVAASDRLDFGFAVGSPVYRREQSPFADDVLFGSARASWQFNPAWTIDLYGVEQRAGAVIDRRALGSELRYDSDLLAAAAGADYDIHQDKLGSAYAAANWQATERLALNATIDHRSTPFLLTSNALSGQDVDDLPSLVKLLGKEQVIALATDRTAMATSIAAGLSYQLSAQWQLTLDALWLDVSDTPASGGVGAVEGTAADLYFSAYVNGSDLLRTDDSGGAGLVFTKGASDTKLSADLFWRVPVDDRTTLSPRLRVSGKSHDDTLAWSGLAWTVTPSLGSRYRLSRNWLLEAEIGASFTTGETDAMAAGHPETQALASIRYEF